MIKLIIHNSYINPPSPPPAFAGGGQNLPLSKERGKSSLEAYPSRSGPVGTRLHLISGSGEASPETSPPPAFDGGGHAFFY